MRASYHKENLGRFEKERGLRMVLFASLGLISHPLIFLSFFFTYIEYGSPYAATSPLPYTGWQLLGDTFHPQISQRIADMQGWYPPLAALLDQGAEAHGFRGAVWTTQRVATLIKKHFGISYHPAHTSRILKRLNYSVQQPEEKATQRDETAISTWKEEHWPALKKSSRGRENNCVRG